MVYIVMGVSSSGKTLIGKKLADTLELPFYDADDLHPTPNIKKMENGHPLTDEDRDPWLKKLARLIPKWEANGGAVLACSALKQSYRKMLRSTQSPVQFIFLNGSKELIAQRMSQRKDHFMPDALLDSQFNALEKPVHALTVDINQSPEKVLQFIMKNRILQ